MADQRSTASQTAVCETDNNSEIEINLSELFYRLIEKWAVILLCAVLGLLLAGVYTIYFVTPMYKATSKLYVANARDSAINLSDLQIGSYLVNDYQEVFKAWEVHEQTIQNLKLNYNYAQMQKMLSVTNPSNTRILYITVTSDNPVEAMNIANEYLTVARQYITNTMALEEPRDFSVALLPTTPSSPNKTLSCLLGFVIGALGAIVYIVIRFVLDDKLKTSDDITKYIGIPTLAVVPELKVKRDGKQDYGAKQ